MNTPQPTHPALLAHLLALAESPLHKGYACITARHQHGAHSVDIDQPCLIIVLRGDKQISHVSQALRLGPGDLLLITRRCRIDAINTPDADSGVYMSLVLPLCEPVLTAAKLLWNDPVTGQGDHLVRLDSADFTDLLHHWLIAMQAAHYVEAKLALAALVVALCRRGYTAILVPPAPSLSLQLCALVRAEPDRNWQSHHFETAMGLSGATLRRRLVAEHTHLRDVITRTRLACALDLLYTTRWPIKTVAAKVGYRSTTRFVHRFTERYGLDPAHIGNGPA